MQLSVDNTTFCVQTKNEEFWIYYVLRDAYKLFKHIIVLDTGSDDGTLDIIKSEFPTITLIEEHYGNDEHKIGNGRNVLRNMCNTYWMFIADADEIWRTDKLQNVMSREVNDGIDVVMVAGWNVQDVNGQLMLRTHDLANRDGLFSPNIHWHKTDYPFESYGLHDTYLPQGKVQYFPARECFAWHMRHTLRSSNNWKTYFRKDKLGYYPYGDKPEQTFEPMPEGWLGDINPKWPNPYLMPAVVR